MPTLEDTLENIRIYKDNLSIYYAVSILVSLAAVGLSWWSQHQRRLLLDNSKEDQSTKSTECEREASLESEVTDLSPPSTPVPGSLKSDELRKYVAENLSSTELEQEKEIEKQQLANILELMKQDQEKFMIGSMQELEDQMKLYRN